jgi:hypothetical protein
VKNKTLEAVCSLSWPSPERHTLPTGITTKRNKRQINARLTIETASVISNNGGDKSLGSDLAPFEETMNSLRNLRICTTPPAIAALVVAFELIIMNLFGAGLFANLSVEVV